MADQHNDNIPALANQVAEDIPDIKENLEFHKDCFQQICTGWNNTSVAALGFIRTIWVPAVMMETNATAAAATGTNERSTNKINIEHWAFDGASEEIVEFDLVMPEGWNRGTIKAKFYWSSATSSTDGDTVEWEIAAGALSDNDAIDAALGTSQVITDTLLANDGGDLQVTAATPALTVGGTPALGDLIHFKVSRNVGGTDDMEEDAWLFGVLIQITETNTIAAW